MFELSFWELVFLAIIILLIVFPFWRIFKRAGLSEPISLLVLVPVANIVAIWYLAFAKWPNLKEQS